MVAEKIVYEDTGVLIFDEIFLRHILQKCLKKGAEWNNLHYFFAKNWQYRAKWYIIGSYVK